MTFYPYLTNQNFDMPVTFNEYVRTLAIVSIIIGFIKGKESKILVGMGLSSFLMSTLSVVMIKSFVISQFNLGYIIFMLLNIFLFFLVIKNLLITGFSNNFEGVINSDVENK